MEDFEFAMFGSGFRVALGRFKFLWPTSKWLRSCKNTQRFIDRYVDKALEHRKEVHSKDKVVQPGNQSNLKVGQNMLYAMAEQTDDRIVLRNESLQAMMAAQETTAVLVSNVFFLLARHKEVWEHLSNEISSLGMQKPDADTLQGLSYVRNVLNECKYSSWLALGFMARLLQLL